MADVSERDIKHYEEEYLNGYREKGFEVWQVKYIRKLLLERLQYYKEKKGRVLTVLEVGIGLEPLFQFVEDFREWICVEPAEDFVKNAKKIDLPNVRIIKGFIEESKSEIENIHFDYVIISSLLHEVEAPEKVLNVVKDIANKDTVIHVNVPNAQSFHRILAMEVGLIDSHTEFSKRNLLLQQHNVFDVETLNELIRTSCGGVHVESQGSFFVKPFSHAQMEKLLEYEIIDEGVLDGFYKMSKYMPEMGSEIYVEFRIADK